MSNSNIDRDVFIPKIGDHVAGMVVAGWLSPLMYPVSDADAAEFTLEEVTSESGALARPNKYGCMPVLFAGKSTASPWAR